MCLKSAACSAASVASNSASKELEGSRLRGSSSATLTRRAYYDGTGPTPHFMMMLRQSILEMFRASTCSQGDSRAKTSVTLERELASRGVGLASGRIVSRRLGIVDPVSRCLRTSQRSLGGVWTPYSQTFPRSGMMRNGIVFQLPPLALRTKGTASRLLPTQTMDSDRKTEYAQGGTPLGAAINWPTPTTADAWTDKLKSTQQKEGSMHCVTLGQAVRMWPTPCARDYRSGMSEEALEKRKEYPRGVNLAEETQRREGNGRLNPAWVEWLMGFPTGWTESNASGTRSSPNGQKR